MSHSEHHRRAPLSAAFVQSLREVFGEVRVLYVKENDVELGEKQPEGVQPVLIVEPEEPKKRKAA